MTPAWLDLVWYGLAGFWVFCAVLCVVIGWQEARAWKRAPSHLVALDLEAARQRRAARRRMERAS